MGNIEWGIPKVTVEKVPDPKMTGSQWEHPKTTVKQDSYRTTSRNMSSTINSPLSNELLLNSAEREIEKGKYYEAGWHLQKVEEHKLSATERNRLNSLKYMLSQKQSKGSIQNKQEISTNKKVSDPNTVDSMNMYMQNNESVVLKVKDVFKVSRGIVVTGIVENLVKYNEQIRIINPDNTIIYSQIMGIAFGKKLVDEAWKGDDVGLLLRGVRESDVQIGAIIEKTTYENLTNNNVFVIEKKVPLKQNIFALIGRIEGNLTIRPNTKMQINTFLGEKLYVNILGIKWEGRIRQEISRGSDIMLSVSGISIDSVDEGDEVTIYHE